MEAELVKNVKHVSNNPGKDALLYSLGKMVIATWKNNPLITLSWITPAEYEANVNAFAATLSLRNSTGGSRRELTQKLKNQDILINKGVAAVKNLLVSKYETDAASYYPQFGIERDGKTFIMPRNRSKRLIALQLMLSAISANGFATSKYGTAYWQSILDEYTILTGKASEVDGSVSSKVSAKNELRKTIVTTHNALINILQGNYPDTYKSVLREWGFQKEKY